MLIAVISDTHRMKNYINIAKKNINKADMVIHLGDNIEDAEEILKDFHGEVYIVSGNCDYSDKYPKEGILNIEDTRIFFTHGDLYGVKYGLNNIYYKTKELNADIGLFGHTHISMIERYDDVILMNPGSISLPRNNGRHIGFIEVEKGIEPSVYLENINV
ncbi:YfcE family phosphodiesterase [Clostridium taeniosporum]|uniref:Phosphoesterase n=1 Tax=Clostridium taeniosporum TaxID=394958 RepID=A0A1D7XGS1_9CLOT|nr:metallophosphoesterase [Clostridium taeniosporum]AOR22553.1 metallophosphoesterase [Clostridium taeniosporum]